MSEPFRASLLLSMPQLQDPNFARTVVLLCDYGPEGAFGLVLNRPTDMSCHIVAASLAAVIARWMSGPHTVVTSRAVSSACCTSAFHTVVCAAVIAFCTSALHTVVCAASAAAIASRAACCAFSAARVAVVAVCAGVAWSRAAAGAPTASAATIVITAVICVFMDHFVGAAVCLGVTFIAIVWSIVSAFL